MNFVLIFLISFLDIFEHLNNFLVFESFRSSKDLKKEIDKILSDYQLIKEDDENYYYDIKQNITITKYELKPGFITSKIYIKFK